MRKCRLSQVLFQFAFHLSSLSMSKMEWGDRGGCLDASSCGGDGLRRWWCKCELDDAAGVCLTASDGELGGRLVLMLLLTLTPLLAPFRDLNFSVCFEPRLGVLRGRNLDQLCQYLPVCLTNFFDIAQVSQCGTVLPKMIACNASRLFWPCTA